MGTTNVITPLESVNIVFNDGKQDVGKLLFKDGKLHFEGNLDESAKLFTEEASPGTTFGLRATLINKNIYKFVLDWLIRFAKSEAAKQYHQQDSEVTKGDLQKLYDEFVDRFYNNQFPLGEIFSFFKPHITSQKSEWISVVPTKTIDLDSSLLLFDGFQMVIGWYDGQDFHTKNGLFLPTHFKYLIPPTTI